MEISSGKSAGIGGAVGADTSAETAADSSVVTTKKSPSTDEAFVSMLSSSYFEQTNQSKAIFDPVKDAIDEGKDE